MPEDNDQEGVICFIQNLPTQTSPEVYGLNENAGITKDNLETLQVCIIWFSSYFLYVSTLVLVVLFCKHISSLDHLCGLVVRVPGYTTEMYCAFCKVRTEFIYVM
jgi:hypothetical protein